MQAKTTRDLWTPDAAPRPRRSARHGQPRAPRRPGEPVRTPRQVSPLARGATAWRAVAASLGVLVVLGVLMAFTRVSARGEIFHGVAVHGVPIGGMSAAAARGQVERLATAIDAPMGEPWIDESGAMPRLMTASPAKQVQIDDFVGRVGAAFQTGEHEIAIPVERQPASAPADAFLATLGVTAVLAVGTSDFAGSEPGWVTNIEVAAALVDGVMIPPGETFSFNAAIGEINATPGFVPAGASENGIAGAANGGGVCQVTTSVFRAALTAGLPIDEWWPHAYRNISYEQGGWAPGFDASVQQPDDDPFGGSEFIFRNTTDSWLLIRASIVNGTILTVELAGQPAGVRVELDEPISADIVSAADWPDQESIDPASPPGARELVQPARDGMTTTVTRRVFGADGELLFTDKFVSVYEPRGAVYRVGPGEADTTGDDQ